MSLVGLTSCSRINCLLDGFTLLFDRGGFSVEDGVDHVAWILAVSLVEFLREPELVVDLPNDGVPPGVSPLPVLLWELLPVIVEYLEASNNLLGKGPLLRILMEPSLFFIKNFVECFADQILVGVCNLFASGVDHFVFLLFSIHLHKLVCGGWSD